MGQFFRCLVCKKSDSAALPLPPLEYMALVCGQKPILELRKGFNDIDWHIDTLEEQQLLGDHIRFLDIGCGCGRLARKLIDKPLASYTGFDRHPGMIDWCNHQITSRTPKFQFLYFSIKSGYETIDQQIGEYDASEFKFPFGDRLFDSVFLASVFTHMSFPEIRNYLSEIHRILAPNGKVLLSVFLVKPKRKLIITTLIFIYRKNDFSKN